MNHITKQIILTKKSKHFLIMYSYSFSKNENKSINETVDGNISFTLLSDDTVGNYESIIRLNAVSEEKNADYKEILRLDTNLRTNLSELDCESLLNILIQSLLSVGSFHNLVGYIHRECICENFLYQINSVDTDGYYLYRFGDETYYLKSCRYNVMISNFEKCKEITMDTEELDNEYTKEVSDDRLENDVPAHQKDAQYKILYLLLEDYKRIFKDFTENENIKSTSVI